ncbi:outer membrane beta-barrel protein [Halioxenophilus sp. WMMB6]|uniref:outer membrane beta-barrel protein n=1 Tax=Halioxenophilus sp. WMMB6 TaxID=3073815 RepID=UPI00295E59BD|nr:outer membrane beta-barrel protein [Halioxenophilus sp. WMMB6]
MTGAARAAEQEIADDLFFSGHATLGLLYNTEKEAQFYRDASQLNADFSQFTYQADSRFGLRLSYKPHSRLGGELQLITRYGLSNEFETNLFSVSANWRAGNGWLIKAGYIPFESFYRADSVHVGYSYLWARPPTEFYTLNIASSFKGVSVRKSFLFGFDTLQLKAYGGLYGKTPSSHPDDQIDARNSPLYGLSFDYISGNWGVSAGYNRIKLDRQALLSTRDNALVPIDTGDAATDAYLVQVLNEALIKDTNFEYSYLGWNYDRANWRLEAVVSNTDTGYRSLSQANSAYFSLGYKFQRLTPYVVITYVHNDELHNLNSGGLSDELNAIIKQSANNTHGEEFNYGLGLRSELAENIALKMQYNHIDSNENPSLFWLRESENWDGNANLFSLVLDMVF